MKTSKKEKSNKGRANLKKRLRKESLLTHEASMEVLVEFEMLTK
jgi:hypothetical protein